MTIKYIRALVAESVDALDLKSNGVNYLVPVQVWPRALTFFTKKVSKKISHIWIYAKEKQIKVFLFFPKGKTRKLWGHLKY